MLNFYILSSELSNVSSVWDLDNLPTVMYKSIQHRATYNRLMEVSIELGRELLRKAALVL